MQDMDSAHILSHVRLLYKKSRVLQRIFLLQAHRLPSDLQSEAVVPENTVQPHILPDDKYHDGQTSPLSGLFHKDNPAAVPLSEIHKPYLSAHVHIQRNVLQSHIPECPCQVSRKTAWIMHLPSVRYSGYNSAEYLWHFFRPPPGNGMDKHFVC